MGDESEPLDTSDIVFSLCLVFAFVGATLILLVECVHTITWSGESSDRKDKIEELARSSYTVEASDVSESPRSCSVCLEPISKGQSAIHLECSHVFHTACIVRWLAETSYEPSCPT